MKLTQISGTDFRANHIKITAEANRHVNNLFLKVMSATSVKSENRSGQVIYRMGKDAGIDISNPAPNLATHLRNLGIKFTTAES